MTTAQEEGLKLLNRALELVQADAELHAALVAMINAITETEKAKAEYQRSRIKP